MTDSREEIKSFFANFGSLWSEYIIRETTQPEVMDILLEIIASSDKGAGEAVLAFFSAIRYIPENKYALQNLEQDRSFRSFVDQNRNEIIALSIQNKVQGNLPERAFPVLEVIGTLSAKKPVCVVELGASKGIIGRTLLCAPEIIAQKEKYLRPEQQLPLCTGGVSRYIGYELQIPERRWFLSCIHNPLNVDRLALLLDNYPSPENFALFEKNAFGFKNYLEDVGPGMYTIVVLTSFFLYQLDEEKRDRLVSEIQQCTAEHNGHWINQAVQIAETNEYYVELDGKRLLKISDDLCTSWEKI